MEITTPPIPGTSGNQIHLGSSGGAHEATDPQLAQIDGLHQKLEKLMEKLSEMDRKIDTINVEIIQIRQELYKHSA